MALLPLTLLERLAQKRVTIMLKDQRSLEGKLTGYDDHMNMTLDDVDELVNDQKARHLGTVVLRGSNIVCIAPK